MKKLFSLILVVTVLAASFVSTTAEPISDVTHTMISETFNDIDAWTMSPSASGAWTLDAESGKVTHVISSSKNGESILSKSFTPMTDGNSLTLKANIGVDIGYAWWASQSNTGIFFGNGTKSESVFGVVNVHDGTKTFGTSFDAWKMTSTPADGFVAYTSDTTPASHSGSCELTATLTPNGDGENYDCVSTLRYTNGSVFTAKWMIDKTEALSYNVLELKAYNNCWTGDDGKSISISDITVKKSGSIEVPEAADPAPIVTNLLNETFDTDFVTSIGDKTTEDYTNGNAWATNNFDNAIDTFAIDAENGQLNMNSGTLSGTADLAKKFAAIQDGETLKLKSTMVFVNSIASGNDKAGSISLALSDGTTPKAFFHLMDNASWVRLYTNNTSLSSWGNASDPTFDNADMAFTKTYGDSLRDNTKATDWHIIKDEGTNGYRLSGDVVFTLTMTPNADGENYDCVADISGPAVGYQASFSIPKAEALAYNEFQLVYKNNGTDETTTVVKDVEITKSVETKSVVIDEIAFDLVEGENTLYIPYNNTTDDDQYAKVVVAIVEGGVQKSFVVANPNLAVGSGTIEISDVVIEDLATESVEVFIFENFTNLKPLSSVLTK